ATAATCSTGSTSTGATWCRGRIRAWNSSTRRPTIREGPGRMRLIFAGTPDFARAALEQLHAAGFDIALVLTQPDRPAGRGMKLQASAVKQWAESQHIPLAQPRSLRVDGKYPDDA